MSSSLVETAVNKLKLVESNLDSKPLTPILNAVGVTQTSWSKIGNAGVKDAGTTASSTVELGRSSKDSMIKSVTSKRKMLNLQGTPTKIQNLLKIELNKIQTGVELSTNNHNAVITLQPKFDGSSNRTNDNPNFLKRTPNLKRRLGM